MGNFQSDFRDAINSRKGSDVADAVGMPDEQDYAVLMRIFQKFEARNPGLIQATLKAGRRDYKAGVHSRKQIFDKHERAVVSKDSNMTYVFELPANLYFAIEAVFPSMFKSKKHFAWFKKNFYKLTIGESAK